MRWECCSAAAAEHIVRIETTNTKISPDLRLGVSAIFRLAIDCTAVANSLFGTSRRLMAPKPVKRICTYAGCEIKPA